MPTPRLPAVARALSIALLALFASGCTIITGPDDEWDREQRDLSRARRTWSSNFINDYEFVVRRDCYCLMGGVAVRITVLRDVVVAREIDGTSAPLPPGFAYLYPSIDGIFSIVQEAIDTRAYRIDASYDSRYGFPTDVYIDYDRRAVDEEQGYTMLRFRALP